MKFIGYVLVIVLLFVFFINTRTPMEYGQERTKSLGVNATKFEIGVIWPFSTKDDGFREGVMLAAEEINSKGVLGRTMEVIFKDTASKVSVAQKAADKFIKNKDMLAVLGHYDSNIAAQLSVGYENAKLLYLDTGACASSLTEHNFDYLIRTTISSRMIADNMVKALAEQGYKNVFMVTQEDNYGREINFHFRYYMDFQDMDICGGNSYFRWEKNYNDIVYNLKLADCDLLFLSGFEPWAGYFLKDMRDMGIRVPFAGAFTNVNKMRAVAGNALQGAMYFTSYDSEKKDPENVDFVDEFVERFGRIPDYAAVTGYDTMHMLAHAIEATDSLDPLVLSRFFKYRMDFDGVNGRYRFSPKGGVMERPFYLKQVKGDESVTIWSNN